MTAVLILALSLPVGQGPASSRPLVRPPDEVEFVARVNVRGFEASRDMAGYHAIVWKGGRAAADALLVADVSDTQVLDALESLGAKPGDNLSLDAWEKRGDPGNAAPDATVAGPGVEILVRRPGRKELTPLSALLVDPAGRGLDLRFAGNRASSPYWKSGCIACLYSCPGGRIGNARYTERDFARGTTRFRVKRGALPPDGSLVDVVVRLVR